MDLVGPVDREMTVQIVVIQYYRKSIITGPTVWSTTIRVPMCLDKLVLYELGFLNLDGYKPAFIFEPSWTFTSRFVLARTVFVFPNPCLLTNSQCSQCFDNRGSS